MSTATLQPHNLAQEIHNMGTALNELTLAARRLAVALWASLIQRTAPRQLTALEEANNLRAIADGLVNKDPSFAQDLYAAADRHEVAANGR